MLYCGNVGLAAHRAQQSEPHVLSLYLQADRSLSLVIPKWTRNTSQY